MDYNFWCGKKVLITGHTGFKGSWLSAWLAKLGAQLYGYSIAPPTQPSMYELLQTDKLFSNQVLADIRDKDILKGFIEEVQPEILFHLAAQPLVRESYLNPYDTITTNIIGTANVLEAARSCSFLRVIVNITTDKCYENKGSSVCFTEDDKLGGNDVYSASKSSTELITHAYRQSFFLNCVGERALRIATVRAGNVIGGGDFAKDRLVPDMIRSIFRKEPIVLRNPDAIRPWQHVLDPIYGYLLLAQRLYDTPNHDLDQAYNFGPNRESLKTVQEIVSLLLSQFGLQYYDIVNLHNQQFHEEKYLGLNSNKAKEYLGWEPTLDLPSALRFTADWFSSFHNNENMAKTTTLQIEEFERMVQSRHAKL